MIWRKKITPDQSLPPEWTQGLWDEFKHATYDFHCFLGIDGLSIEADFHAEYGATEPSVSRNYYGFLGGDPSSQQRLLRADLNFTADPSDLEIINRLPPQTAGWGQTLDMNIPRGPKLQFNLFASLEIQKEFEELVIRAKLLHLDHVAVSIWANVIEPWYDTNEQGFPKVFNVCRVIFGQQIGLGNQR